MRQPVETVWFVATGGGRRRVSGSSVLDVVRDLLAIGEKPSISYVVAYAGEYDVLAHQVEIAVRNAQAAKTIIDNVVSATFDPATSAAKLLDRRMRAVVAVASDDELEAEWLLGDIDLDPQQIADAMCRAYRMLHEPRDPEVSAAEALDRRVRGVA